ncbi:MAG: LytTR family transcriptional regulator [Marinisporobacter sp.]|nr:LytTR family transcriptional regulator [Marinisporobacter sp.]
MKIQIDVCKECETEVLIKGDTSKNEVKELIEHINNFSLDITPNKILLKDGEKSFIKDIEDIWYFEARGNRLNAIIDQSFYVCKFKLYQIENFKDKGYIRISKSIIVNVNKIEFMEMEFSGNYTISLKNKKKLILSRNYVKKFKKYVEEVL